MTSPRVITYPPAAVCLINVREEKKENYSLLEQNDTLHKAMEMKQEDWRPIGKLAFTQGAQKFFQIVKAKSPNFETIQIIPQKYKPTTKQPTKAPPKNPNTS